MASPSCGAVVRATPEGWALSAQGGSRYGPFSADLVIQSNRRPFTIRVNRLTYAGVDFQRDFGAQRRGAVPGDFGLHRQRPSPARPCSPPPGAASAST